MPAKKLRTDLYGNVQPDLFKKAKSKPKPYTEAVWLTQYKRDRDRCLWRLFPGSREEIENKYKEI